MPFQSPCNNPCGYPIGIPPCEPICNPPNPCPLRSFCDAGLANTCNPLPLVNPCAPRRAVTTWRVNYLVSNRNNHAAHIDLALINPWGIVIFNNQLWVANNMTDTITNYDLFGNNILRPTSIRNAVHNSSYPTGIVVNCGGGFSTTNGLVTRTSQFLITSEHGTVHAHHPQLQDSLSNCTVTKSNVVLNQQLTGEVSVYKGLALANNTLYLADFFQSHIDVFDSSYNRLLGFHFIDGDTCDPIPLDYGPNNIVNIGCHLYVLWARKEPHVSIHDFKGPGQGYISVFNLNGSFVRRFTSRGVLNAPWGMIPAPCECGFAPGSFLVSNTGDGRINVFDCNGRYAGPMLNQAGLPIFIDGVRGLAPHYTDFSEIFFTASANEDTEGLVGSIIKDQVIYF